MAPDFKTLRSVHPPVRRAVGWAGWLLALGCAHVPAQIRAPDPVLAPVEGTATLLSAPAAAESPAPAVMPMPAGASVAAALAAPSAAPAAPAAPVQDPSELNDDDRYAGLVTREFPMKGRGKLRVVKGSSPPPEGEGKVKRIRVEVESGIKINRKAFANFVMETLNDPRSWRHKSHDRFERTDGNADIRVVLATPTTSAELCKPMTTRGVLSCRRGNAAYLTMYRWVNATPDYQSDRNGYRRYLVNHEVGHALGRAHARCKQEGWLAPVMLQQTISLAGCRPNSWPYPWAGQPAGAASPEAATPAPDDVKTPPGAGSAAPIVPDDMPVVRPPAGPASGG